MRIIAIGLLTVAMCVTLSTAQANANVLAQWDFDQSSGSTLPDISGNGNNGVLLNMDDSNWVTGITGQALNFDGVNEWVSFPTISSNINSLLGAMTIEFWVKAGPDQRGLELVIDKSHGFVDNSGWAFQKSGSSLAFAIGQVGFNEIWAEDVFDDQWHYIVGTYDLSDMKLYVDGELKNSSPMAGPQTVSSRPLEMGSAWGGGDQTRFFSGSLDNAAIYDVALDAETIKQHAVVTPEPASMVLFGLGGAAMAFARRRMKA